MSTVTVNVSFSKALLKSMDAVARQESRTRSELLREAVRMYVERKHRWEHMFSFGETQAKRLGLQPDDVESLIGEYRTDRSRKRLS